MPATTLDGAFRRRVYQIVRLVPRGKVATYGDVALYGGMPRRARHVGWALHSLPDALAWGAAGDIRRLAGARPGPAPIAAGPAGPAGANPAAEAGGESPVPWHRVINAQGRVSTHPEAYGTRRQIELLRQEGLAVTDDGVLVGGLEAHRWEPGPEELEGLELPPEVLFRLDPPDR